MIDSFRGPYRFLSNFYPSLIVYEGAVYATVEHAYQAAKTVDLEWREALRLADTPGEAKRMGRHAPLRADWEQVKVSIMTDLVFQKFVAHQDLGDLLLATGDEELVEGNEWGDRYWGVCNGIGLNVLGQILSHVRGLLRKIRAGVVTA